MYPGAYGSLETGKEQEERIVENIKIKKIHVLKDFFIFSFCQCRYADNLVVIVCINQSDTLGIAADNGDIPCLHPDDLTGRGENHDLILVRHLEG